MTTPTLFPLFPSDGSPLVETFNELTAVSTARWSGRESRRALRAFPQLVLAGNFQLWGDEYDQLEPMRSGGKVLVPAWMHPVQDLATAPRLDALYNRDALTVVKLLCQTADDAVVVERECTQTGLLTTALPAGTVKAYPLVEARLTEDSFDVESKTSSTHFVGLSFLSTTTDEGDTYTGATFDGLPVFPAPGDGTEDMRDGGQALRTETVLAFDRWSAGHIEVEDFLYARGIVSGRFRAMTRTDVIALRAFLRACRGRASGFWWPHPKTGALTRWRLAADSVSLSYLTTTTAEASLRFVELPE